MVWILRDADTGTDHAGAVLPNVRADRGMDVNLRGLEPKAGRMTFVTDRDVVRSTERIELLQDADAFWAGEVTGTSQSVDRQLNQLRWRVGALGPLVRIVQAGSGRSTQFYTAITVDEAIGHLLDAVGIAAADRDIGASSRELAVWWLDADENAWDALQTLVRTAGPRARVWEDAQGRIAFRDVAPDPMPDFTVRGRNATAPGDAIVSTLDDEGDEKAIERVINRARVSAQEVDTEVEFVGALTRSNLTNNSSTASLTFTAADLQAAGAQVGDLIVLFMATIVDGTSVPFYTWTTSFNRVTLDNMGPSVGGNRYHANITYGRYAGVLTAGASVGGNSRIRDFSVLALIYRNAEDPTNANAEVIVTPGESPPAPLPNPASEGSRVLVGAVDMRVSGGTFTMSLPGESAGIDPDWTRRDPTGAVIRAYDQVFAAGGQIPTDDVFDQGVITRAGLFSIELGPMRAVVWEYEGNDIVLAAGEQRSFRAPGDGFYFGAIAPSTANGDIVVSAGAVTATIDTGADNITTITLTAGAAGATITALHLRAFSISQAVDNPQTREDAGSIAAYGERGYDQRLWPYLTQSEAAALAQEIVDYSSHPRRAWTVKLDADRNADTAAAARAELGQTVRTNIDADFDHTGEVVGLEHQVSGPAGLLETRLSLLALAAVPLVTHRLFLGSTANPLFLGTDQNPMELR